MRGQEGENTGRAEYESPPVYKLTDLKGTSQTPSEDSVDEAKSEGATRKALRTKLEAQAINAADQIIAVQKHGIPLAVKTAGAAFMAVLMPIYLNTYGITNFLWFCDAALILTMVGMGLENSLLISMSAVGILILQCLWLADFGSACLGIRFLGLTTYMFDRHLSLFTRGLSLFHGWLPLLLVWLLFRLGYDKRALAAWTVLAAGLGFVCYFFTPPAGAHLSDPDLPLNINYLYGFNDQKPQTWVNENLYVVLWLGALWLVAFLPTHLALRKIFTEPQIEACLRTPVRIH